MGRIVFGMIGNRDRPIGGVKVIYQAVAALRRHGLDAHVVADPTVPPWLAGSPAVEGISVIDCRHPHYLDPADLFVAVDSIGPDREELLLGRPERRIMFFQNHNAIRLNTDIDWTRLRHIRALTVSEYSRSYLMENGGFTEVAVVPPGVDLSVFRPPPVKHRRIVYMPRKWPRLAEELQARLSRLIECRPIDGRTEAEVARALGDAAIFLNLGKGEGFGLPAIEAMASGCVVCGFAGEGTTDYATPDNGHWADEGDVPGLVQALKEAIATLADPELRRRRVRAGIETAKRYSLPVFEARMASYFREIL